MMDLTTCMCLVNVPVILLERNEILVWFACYKFPLPYCPPKIRH